MKLHLPSAPEKYSRSDQNIMRKAIESLLIGAVDGTSSGLTGFVITSPQQSEVLIYQAGAAEWQNGFLDFDELAGDILDSQVPESAVTQHEAALSIACTQLTGDMPDARIVESNVTQHEAALSIACSQLTGDMPDARIVESNVTQHAVALNALMDHGDMVALSLLDDDHPQYLLLAGRAGGQTAIGGTLTTETLILQDNAVDANFFSITPTGFHPGVDDTYDLGESSTPLRWRNLYLSGTITSCHLYPSADATCDLGEESTPLNWRTLYLSNDGGAIIDVPSSLQLNGASGAASDYKMWLGGGGTGIGVGGGLFTFEFASAVIGGENLLTFDLGAVWFAGGPTISNDFIIQCDNGLDIHRFIAKFGGWTNPEYGWALDRIVGIGENLGKTLFFDNQEPVSDSLRSIDFRIDGINVLTIENEVTTPPADVAPKSVDFPLKYITAPTGVVINRFCEIDSETVFNLIDVCNIRAVNTNAACILSVKPKGTSTLSASLCTNAFGTVDYGTLENSLSGTIARLATWRYNAGVGPTELRIGEMASSFFGIGLFGTLTEISFWFNNAVEMEIRPDTLEFNNGAVLTQLDWSVNGQLGLQVATNDVVRLTAATIDLSIAAAIEMQIQADTIIFNNGAIDTQIDWATNGELGLQIATVDVERLSAGRELISGVEAYPALSPSALTADVDDYAPATGAAQRHVWRATTDGNGPWNITGIAVQATSDSMFIINIHATDSIVLQDQNASSVAANRIISPTGADLTLGPNEYAYLWYDATTARWRILDTNGA